MNRLWVVPFLCALMIALSACAAVDAAQHWDDCSALLTAAESAAGQEQWDTVRTLVRELRNVHDGYLRHAGWYASDDRLNDAADSLWELTAAAEAADRAAVALSVCRSRAALQALKLEQQWSWGALL